MEQLDYSWFDAIDNLLPVRPISSIKREKKTRAVHGGLLLVAQTAGRAQAEEEDIYLQRAWAWAGASGSTAPLRVTHRT